jgi:hypothetical protein
MILSEPVVAQAAEELGMPIKEVQRVYLALGRVMQSMLLQGRAVGIPSVGGLKVISRRVDGATERKDVLAMLERVKNGEIGKSRLGKNPDALARALRTVQGWKPPSQRRAIKFHTSLMLRRMFSDNCLDCGSIKEQVQDVLNARASLGKNRPKIHRKRLGAGKIFLDKTGQPVSPYYDAEQEAP